MRFQVGDSVLLINTTQKGEGRKLQPLYTGPHKIIEIISEVNSKILDGKKHKIVHNNRLKKYVSKPDTTSNDKKIGINCDISLIYESSSSEVSEQPLQNSITDIKVTDSKIPYLEEVVNTEPKPLIPQLKDILQTFPWTQYSNKACAETMLDMGFEPGKGLGKFLQGIPTAIHTGDNSHKFDSQVKTANLSRPILVPIKFIPAQNME